MKRLRSQWRITGYSFVLFEVVLSAALAAGQISASPSNLDFGTVQVGSSATQSLVLTNVGGSTLLVSQFTVTGPTFSMSASTQPTTLAPGQSKTLKTTFTPQSIGNTTGSISVVFSNWTYTGRDHRKRTNFSLKVPLTGIGTGSSQLVSNPARLSFGSVQVGNNQTLYETLTNSGDSSVSITQATVSGSGFTFYGLNPPQTLTSGQSITFSVTFAPNSNGAVNGSLSVVSTASNPNLSVPLSGTGTSSGQLTVSPSSINFGNVVVGNSQSQTGTLAAAGSSVTVSSGTSNSTEFVLSGISFPLTLGAGQSTSFTVTFTPQTSGPASAKVSFVSNALGSTTTQFLSGSGTSAPQHAVDLSWTASTSVVAGYNVYRGGKSGGPYTKINSVLDALTNYTDSGVQAGQTYYYVTTAVDSGGLESGYSNEAPATIPTP